ncbi:Histidine kinase-, DNA gyrase B-, and HSP90-like ATPase [Butyrivibrio sp. INlla18]|uniref:response regulator n=1 Tax=Butyrivibrio sp. INlla18 TaxID=1520806 RepID=UPI00088D59A4|nr:response regulator [Butyrivibrio sp. INlla18]SDA53568.1 Histidine kinase-, DNA gyrase B-, and HSP90-like ATPase [Butyrivibrio sp. INlla18]
MRRMKKLPLSVYVQLCMIGISSILTIFYSKHIFHVEDMNQAFAGIFYAFKYIPIITVTALGGAVPGMVSVLLVFLYRSIVYSSFSYLVFVYLILACVVDFMARKKFFSSVYKTLLVSVILQLISGDFWGILLFLLAGIDVSSVPFHYYVTYFLNEAPGCLIGCFIVYFVFKKLTPEKKLLFGNGKFYVKPEFLSEDERYEVERRSKIGAVVMQIIVFEAIILGISAELASNTLIPTMKVVNSSTNNSLEQRSWEHATNAEKLESLVSIEVLEGGTADSDGFVEQLGGSVNYQVLSSEFSVKLAMLISIIVIPLAVFFNGYAQRRIARPIRTLSKAVSDIYNSKEIDISQKVREVHELQIDTNDEIEDLYHAVDLTFYRLMEYIELVKTRQSIEDQLNIEKSANEAKSRFLSNISHEIRTPINAVLGFDEMILRETTNEKVLEYAKDIQSSGKTLLALINDILDFSKIEAGKMEIIPVEYDVRSLINDIINMASIKASEKHLELKLLVDENIPHILFGDEVRIKQCILNLITNAIKYTERGSVTLDMKYERVLEENPEDSYEEKIALAVSVTDTGIGIREEDMEKLDQAFERIDEKRNRTIEGTGLGINIVNSLLNLMDSKLSVKSEYGAGSEFSFTIIQTVVDAEPVGDIVKAFEDAAKSAHEYHETFHAPDARILVVDDTRTNLTVVEGLLKQTQIVVDTATSGMEALDLVKKNKYDIIFLDHRMPEMDGIQTFHAMEEMQENLNKKVPVIALTANAVSGSREMYYKEGFTNYMSKPVEPMKLEEMIMSYLPSYKISKPGDKDYVEDSVPKQEAEKEAMQDILKINGIDIETAISRCGSPEVAKEVMKDFRLAIDERSGLIEKYFNEKNYKNYTIYVHGLKSSARAIGALDLAEKAEYLEECGNKEDVAMIEKLTPSLIEQYRSYNNKLASLFEEDNSDKPLIDPEELEGAFLSMKEFVAASYFDSADDIMNMLDEYQIPKEYADKYHDVKRLLAAVDRDGLLRIL